MKVVVVLLFSNDFRYNCSSIYHQLQPEQLKVQTQPLAHAEDNTNNCKTSVYD